MEGQPFHVIQRGNNRSVCFYADEDYQFYLHQLHRIAAEQQVAIHAYVLMTNHVHLLLTGNKPESLSKLMKHLGQRYVQYINKTYKRSGTLWEGRFKSSLIDGEAYLLACQRYIELNPVRAGMVKHPAEYDWSSYRFNAQGEDNHLVKPHETYLRLSVNQNDREAAYQELFRHELDPGVIDEIREATNSGYVLGRAEFREEIEKLLKRRVEPGKPGRPMKRDMNYVDQQQLEL